MTFLAEKLTIDSCEERETSEHKRRSWTRIPVENQQIMIVTPEATYHGTIVDESFGGIGVLLEAGLNVSIGQKVKLIWRDAPIFAIVRNIKQIDDQLRIGMQWVEKVREKRAQRKEVAEFFVYCGLFFVCDEISKQDNNSVSFKHPDGSMDNLPPGNVIEKTKEERLHHLNSQDSTTLSLIAGVYQLAGNTTKQSTVDAILKHEFGC